eukprot:1161981-Pelagomonas_calceolata.AAC.16
MALMNRAGGGAHAGGLPPLDNSSDMQRRRNQAAIRRLTNVSRKVNPNFEPTGKALQRGFNKGNMLSAGCTPTTSQKANHIWHSPRG